MPCLVRVAWPGWSPVHQCCPMPAAWLTLEQKQTVPLADLSVRDLIPDLSRIVHPAEPIVLDLIPDLNRTALLADLSRLVVLLMFDRIAPAAEPMPPAA